MRVGSGATGWVLLFAAAAATAAPTYTVTPIPATERGQATAISENGGVAGYISRSEGNRAFRWNGTGAAEVLGTLGGTFSQATGVNAAGTVVGFTVDAADFERAFRFAGNGQMENLDALGGPRGVAFAINDAGTIAGNGGAYRDLPGCGTASVSPGIPTNATAPRSAPAVSSPVSMCHRVRPRAAACPARSAGRRFATPARDPCSLSARSAATASPRASTTTATSWATTSRRCGVVRRQRRRDQRPGSDRRHCVSRRERPAAVFRRRLDPAALPEPPVSWLVLAGALVAAIGSGRRR
jgi:probable HAF family extracellular repeat protein